MKFYENGALIGVNNVFSVSGLRNVNEVYGKQIFNNWVDLLLLKFLSIQETGRLGPTLSEALASYDLSKNPWLENTLQVSAGIQSITIPSTGRYKLTIAGSVGATNGTSQPGGGGRIISGEYDFTAGDVMEVLVGKTVETDSDNCGGTSGGGGTFVVLSGNRTNSNIIGIAGGGGGGGTSTRGGDGLFGTSGGDSGTSNGGNNGNGGQSGEIDCVSDTAGGGGGFFTNGGSSSGGGNGGAAFVNGGDGGTGRGTPGGFGGGGGSAYGGGGGGGYSGGAGGGLTSCSCSAMLGGGGGGSYTANLINPVNEGVNSSGAGYFVWEKI